MAAATFDLRPAVSKKEWAIEGKLEIVIKLPRVLFLPKHFLGVAAEPKPCQEDWVELSSPGNTSSDAPTLSLSHQQVYSSPYWYQYLINVFETPGNSYSNWPTLSLSRQEEKCERVSGEVEERRRRKKEFFNLSPQPRRLHSLATTLLVSKLVDTMVGLVLVLVETTVWLVAWCSNQSPLAPIFLLLPTPISSFLWLATRSRTKNSDQVIQKESNSISFNFPVYDWSKCQWWAGCRDLVIAAQPCFSSPAYPPPSPCNPSQLVFKNAIQDECSTVKAKRDGLGKSLNAKSTSL